MITQVKIVYSLEIKYSLKLQIMPSVILLLLKPQANNYIRNSIMSL